MHPDSKFLKKLTIPAILIVILGLCWFCTPMQIKGSPEDDFRAFVVDPIPDSVDNLEVKDNDMIILPDRTYCFRFNILPEDLDPIITADQLQLVKEDVTGFRNYNIDAEDWTAEEAETKFDYYEFRDPDERPQLIIELWLDKLNNKVIYCYSSL